MNFDFTDDQKELGSVVRRFLDEHSTSSHIRSVYESNCGYDRESWTGLGDLGMLGAAIPEEYGGSGAGYLELCIIAEEIGRALAPIPFTSSICLAAEAILLAGSEQQKFRYLPEIAAGRKIAAVALNHNNVRPILSDNQLNGQISLVHDAPLADYIIITATQDERATLVIIDTQDSGVTIENRKAVDRAHPIGRVILENASAESMVGAAWEDASGVCRIVHDRAAILIAFEQLGGAERALETARDYALERHAFNRPIGSFQAMKHMLADMFVATQLARSNCYFGAWALQTNADDLPLAAATARVSATEAYEQCSANNIQVHGGIGFTWDVDCHLFYRRSNGLAQLLGGRNHWDDRLITELDKRTA